MKSILILGGSGFIGNCLYKELAPYYNTFATYNTAKGYRNNQHFFYFNLEEGGLDSILKEVRPKLIISALRGEFNVQIETHDFLIKLIKKSDCRILFLSSSNVFDSFEHMSEMLRTAFAELGKTGRSPLLITTPSVVRR